MKQTIFINGLRTQYRREGQGDCILLLHGWGGNCDSFAPLFDSAKNFADVISLDLWGFGGSDAPSEPFNADDYADLIKQFLDMLRIEKASVAGHSFGGRAAISLAARYGQNVQKTVLIDSAGLKPRLGIIKRLKVLRYKLLKRLNPSSPKLAKMGSSDYRKLTESMRKTFVKTVNFNQAAQAKRMCSETLIIWGEKDRDTPLWMGRKLKKYIKGSGLVVLKNAGHFSYLDNFAEFWLIFKSFFGWQ